jgi:hypothetical protein
MLLFFPIVECDFNKRVATKPHVVCQSLMRKEDPSRYHLLVRHEEPSKNEAGIFEPEQATSSHWLIWFPCYV